MRIVNAGGFLLAVPHVAGFSAGPTTWQVQTSAPPQPSAFSLRSPRHHAVAVHSAHRHRRGAEPTLAAAESAWSCSSQGVLGSRRYRRRQRQWCATPAASATATGAVSRTTSLPAVGASTLGDHDDDEPSNGTTASADERGVDRVLRLVVVGPNADELGVKMAERHGLAATSMDELMKGRKGRKTDAVKAKAASKWLAEEKCAAGGILTGFPATAAQAESLEKQGVALEHLVLIVQETLAGEPPRNNEDGSNSSENGEEAEVGGEILMTRYKEKVVKVAAGAEGDIESLCDSVARLVVTLPSPGSGGASGSDDGAVGGGGLGEKEHSVDVDSEEVAEAEVGTEVKEAEEGYSPLLASTAMMSPSERQLASGRDPASYEAAVRLSRSGAEAKRAAREKTKQRKRDANEAQQMDTPFYVAVAQGQPKARFRPQVPTVPSRITERLQSATSAPDGEGGGTAANTQLEFGPLVIDSPASDCLLAAGITKPTGIQAAGMGPILAGESVILHAMTGSGKTLTFLLPLMQRWAPGLFSASAAVGRGVAAGAEVDGPFRVLLALPTRELAVQVAREVVLLSGGLTASVELLVDSSVFHDLSSVKAPIVVGSAKVLERLVRKSRPAVRAEVLPRVKCIVVDEVDRLVDVLSKHAPPKEVEKRKRHARPIAALLERVLQSSPDAQVVACSATIGRPLRRELGHIVRRSSALGSANGVNGDGGGNGGGDSSSASGGGTSGSRELRVVRDQLGASGVENLATERAVAIPDTISHYCVPLAEGDFFSRLEGLTAAVRELQPRRPLVFVPPGERVTAVVAHLRRSGGDVGRRAVALHEAMGFVSDEERGGVRGQHACEAILQHDRLAEEFRGVSNERGGGGGAAGVGDAHFLGGSGVGGRLREGESGALLVTGEDSARGLHFDDVDFVFLMQKPKSPDEYVHLAGRTGRQGRTGTVVTLVEFEEFRKLQAWSSSLKVHFEPLDILKVVKR